MSISISGSDVRSLVEWQNPKTRRWVPLFGLTAQLWDEQGALEVLNVLHKALALATAYEPEDQGDEDDGPPWV